MKKSALGSQGIEWLHHARNIVGKRIASTHLVRADPRMGGVGCPGMDKAGRWSLAPAFDVTYSYNPAGSWTATHQMTMNGKRDGFTLADFRACAKSALMKRGRAEAIVEEVRAAVAKWPDYAEQAQVMSDWRKQIQRSHRLDLPRT